MLVPVVRRALESIGGVYSPEDYGLLQLTAEVGEQEPDNVVAVGPFAFFQMYTGSLGYWTYEGNSPFMGLENLSPLLEFVRAFDWPELAAELSAIEAALAAYTSDQLAAYASFTLDNATHREIDAITFPMPITDMIVADAADGAFPMFRKATVYLESVVEFLAFEDRAALVAWKAAQN